MKTHFLFSNKLKSLGWILLSAGIAGAIAICSGQFSQALQVPVFAFADTGILGESTFFGVTENSIIDELVLLLLIIGGILVGFSKTKNEDELIGSMRYESLVWATYFNFGLLMLSTVFIYGMAFLQIMFMNVFSVLIFFIARFHYKIYQLNKSSQHEE